MLAVLGGIVLVVIGVILAANASNNARMQRIIREGPSPEEFWKDYFERFGPDGGPHGGSIGPGRPEDYEPGGFIAGAVLCFIGALVLFCIA